MLLERPCCVPQPNLHWIDDIATASAQSDAQYFAAGPASRPSHTQRPHQLRRHPQR